MYPMVRKEDKFAINNYIEIDKTLDYFMYV